MPGAAIGIDVSGPQAVVAMAVGGNAVVLADREGLALDLTVPAPSAATPRWQELFEKARLRAERALARPVTHAVVAVAAGGLAALRLVPPEALPRDIAPALAAAMLAEDLAPPPAARP